MVAPAPQAGVTTATQFLRLLWEHIPTGWVHVFTLDRATGDRRTIWAELPEVDNLAWQACSLTADVWFGPAPRDKDYGSRRGGVLDCTALSALWVDIDVAGPNHVADDLPPTLADARRLLEAFPLPPTVVVETGGGLQAWWFLSEPLERAEAVPLLARWGTTWAELGRRHGWHVDNVFDLARVMRLPGTWNHKTTPPARVALSGWDPSRRYGADDLDQFTLEAPEQPAQAPRSVPYIGPERPGDAFNAVMDAGLLVERLGGVFDHQSNGDRHYRAPHHDKRGETGIVAYADGHITVYSETFAKAHHLRVRRPYDAFGLYCHAYHQGDWHGASEALGARGYGTKDTPPSWDIPAPEEAPPEGQEDDWASIDLADIAARIRSGEYEPTVPTVLGVEGTLPLLYGGRINSLFGESGGGKSWVALTAVAEVVRAGGRALFIDWEDNPSGIAERLVLLGLDDDEVTRVDYRNPTTGIGLGITSLRAAEPRTYALIVVDSTGEAMAAEGVDSNADQEVATWFATVKRLCRMPGGPAVLVLDHIPKDKDAPSSYAIGSQRKRAAVTGAAYRVDTVREPAKGRDGLLKLTVTKDRLGNRARGTTAAMAEVESSDSSIIIRLVMSDAQVAEQTGETFRPTVIMEKVSRWLEINPGANVSEIRSAVKSKKDTTLDALNLLVEAGHVVVTQGARGARNHMVVMPFRDTRSGYFWDMTGSE